jgi:hypothetical protein
MRCPPETRKSLDAFAWSSAHAQGVLRKYHAAVPSAFTGQIADPMSESGRSARSRALRGGGWSHNPPQREHLAFASSLSPYPASLSQC